MAYYTLYARGLKCFRTIALLYPADLLSSCPEWYVKTVFPLFLCVALHYFLFLLSFFFVFFIFSVGPFILCFLRWDFYVDSPSGYFFFMAKDDVTNASGITLLNILISMCILNEVFPVFLSCTTQYSVAILKWGQGSYHLCSLSHGQNPVTHTRWKYVY